MTTRITRFAATAATTVLLASAAVVSAPLAATAAPGPIGDTIDYFDDAYANLPADSVFEAVTYERLEDLLNTEGTFAVLIGGPDDPTTNAVIGVVDEVATTLGVDTVYNFNPKLDGATLDIRTTTNPDFGVLWPNLVDNYLSKDAETPFTKDVAGVTANPYLFVYDKSGGDTNRILAALTGVTTAEELVDPLDLDAFRTEVTAVLDAADLDTRSQFEFYSQNINTRHTTPFSNPATHGGNILGPEDSDFRLQSITYPELVDILQSEGDFVVFFGGTWCHNTRAVVKAANQFAVENDVNTVYFFDLRLDGASGNQIHIRDTKSEFAHLYGDLVTQYLPNLVTQYVPSAGQRVDYFPGGDTSLAKVAAKKLQVPYFIHYNKDHQEGGQPAPVVREWIQANSGGTYTEYMTEWWWVLGLTGGSSNPTSIANNQAFATAAITALDAFFVGFRTDLTATAPESPAAPTATVSGDDVTVTWVEPANGGSAITGYKVALNGGTAVSVASPATSHTFTALTPGDYSATVIAVNVKGESGTSPASTSVEVEEAPEPPDPTTVKGTVVVSGDLKLGGTVTITGENFAEATSGFSVQIHSTPQTLGTVSTNGAGGFTLTTTIPTSVGAGAHSIVVFVNGVEVGRAAISVGALAFTGSNSVGLIVGGVIGLGVLAAGAALLLIARRRRARSL